MIKDEEIRRAEYNNFPRISYDAINEIDQYCLPQFLFYQKTGRNKAWIFCTSCRQNGTFRREEYVSGIRIGYSNVPDMLKHNEMALCPFCHHQVQMKAEGRGHKHLTSSGNYCIFSNKDNKLYIHAIKRRISWECLVEPYSETFFFKKYAFTPDGAQQWRYRAWTGAWEESKSVTEPHFDLTGGMGMTYSPEDAHLYTCINEGCIDSTFLKYQGWDDYAVNGIKPIKFLNFCTRYPRLAEELTKSGFDYLVTDLAKGEGDIHKYINLRAKTVKKALKFSSPEMRFWGIEYGKQKSKSEKSSALLTYFKNRHLFPDRNVLMEFISKYGSRNVELMCEIMADMGCTHTKVMNYFEKHSPKDERTSFMREFIDMHRLMDTLGYPKDSCLRWPADMHSIHDRMTRENNDRIAAEQRAKLKQESTEHDKKIKAQEKKLKKFVYENYLYKIVLPESIEDIHIEGKVLDHCVASYAKRHAEGTTHIFFIRKQWAPEERFYTIEVSKEGRIIQWYGYKDNRTIPKHPAVKEFVEEYQIFLNELFEREEIKAEGAEKQPLLA